MFPWPKANDGCLKKCDYTHLIKKLNRTLFSTCRFAYAIDELGKALGAEVLKK